MSKKAAKEQAVTQETQPEAVAETVAPASSEPAPAPAPEIVTKLAHNKKLSLIGEYGPDSLLSWHVTTNPRLIGRATFDRFAKYIGTPDVKSYMAAGGTKGDLLWDLRTGYLSIQGITLSGDPMVRVVKVKAPKAPKVPKVKAEKVAKVKDPEVQILEDAIAAETETM